jgi:pectin methylesterase-like acyl-CoA thioesterase
LATQGDTVYVKKGTYKEHSLVINKTITLIGEDKNTTIIENIDTYDESSLLPSIFLNPLIAVEIRANNVKLMEF